MASRPRPPVDVAEIIGAPLRRQRFDRLWRVSPEPDCHEAARKPATARWHTRGPDVLYTSATEALAVIEALAHLPEHREPHRLLSIEVPRGASLRVVAPAALPADWRRRQAVTRAIGDAWLASGESDLLWVPSVHVKFTGNVLLNPVRLPTFTSTDHGLLRFGHRLRRPKH